MQYVTTAERIGIQKGKEEGKVEGKVEGILIGQILLAQRKLIKKQIYSLEELEMKSLDELNGIWAGIENKLN